MHQIRTMRACTLPPLAPLSSSYLCCPNLLWNSARVCCSNSCAEAERAAAATPFRNCAFSSAVQKLGTVDGEDMAVMGAMPIRV